MMTLRDMKELCEMISDIKTKAGRSKVYKDKCVALADYIDNLNDSFRLLQSSSAFLSDHGVQRSLAVLKRALQKTVAFMESCGNPLTAASAFSKGPAAVKELKEDVQEGLSLLSLALSVHNARKNAQLLEPTTSPLENRQDSHSNTAPQTISAGLPSGESSQQAEAGDPFGEILQKTEALDPFGKSSQKETGGPSGPSGSSKNVAAEAPHILDETSQKGTAGSSVSDKKLKNVVGEPSGEVDASSQAANAGSFPTFDGSRAHIRLNGHIPLFRKCNPCPRIQAAIAGSSEEVVGKSTENALANPSALVGSSKAMLTTPSVIFGWRSHTVVSTPLAVSAHHAHRIPATSFWVIWSEHPQYWVTIPCNGSTFDKVLYLRKVCWLEARAKLDTSTLKPGTYTVTWRYKLQCLDDCWEHAPVTFKMSEVGGQVLVERPMYLCPKVAVRYNGDLTVTECTDREEMVPLCSKDAPSGSEGIWIEYPVFNFTVDEGDKQQLEFTLMEVHAGHWKQGLVLDAVFIIPRL